VGEYLHRRIGEVIDGRTAELCANVVGAGGCCVASKSEIREVAPLLGLILNEDRGIQAGLRDVDVEYTGACSDGNRHTHIHTLLGGRKTGKGCQGHADGGTHGSK